MSRSRHLRMPALAVISLLLLTGLPSPAAAAAPGAEQAAAGSVDSVIVTYDDAAAARPHVQHVVDGTVTALTPDVVALEVDDAAAAVEALADAPGVRDVEPDWPLTLSATASPDDPHLGVQWALQNTGQSGGTPGSDIAALAAWDTVRTRGADDVVVAITDSGIDGNHPDLSARMWRNDGTHGACPVGSTGYDFVQGTCTTGGTDPINHGTHVAGTVAAAIGNSTGVAGVAPNARLLDLRIMDETGTGSTSHAIAAVNLATSLAQSGVPIRVLNASWGGTHHSTALRDAIAAAGAAGIVVVAAAGNDGRDNDVTPTYPCAYPSSAVICVAASDRTDARPGFSNYGRTTVDLAAPGVEIASTTSGGQYTYLSGTSMAAPHVAGVAALLMGTCTPTVSAVREAILGGVDRVAAFGSSTVTGGRLDAAGALVAGGCAGGLAPPGAPGPALVGPSSPVVSWTAGGGDVFALQRANPGSSTWTDLAAGLTEPRFDLSRTSEGRMDLRVVATRDGQTATSPVTGGVVIDRTPPTVTVTGCPTSDVPAGTSVQVGVTASDAGSGLATDPSGTDTLDTRTVGTTTATYTATDRVGLATAAGCTYSVTEALPAGGGGSGGTGSSPEPAPLPDGTDDSAADAVPLPDDEALPLPDDEPVDVIEVPAHVEGEGAAATALEVSRLRFGDVTSFAAADVRPAAAHAVLARDDEFADALAGAPLIADGPLLLTPAAELDQPTAEELQRLLPPGGTVYLLGGEHALHATLEADIRELGLAPRRLSGPSRIETSLRIADEVLALGGGVAEVLVARAYGPADNPTAAWADAISGGAYGAAHGIPVVLTSSDVLHPSVAEWLARTAHRALLLGGTAALSEGIQTALPGSTRISGPDRAATAATVATDMWRLPAPLASTLLIDGWAVDGWAHGLAAAGLAADLGAPLLLLGQTLPPATAAVLGCGTDTTTIGPATAVSYLDQGCTG